MPDRKIVVIGDEDAVFGLSLIGIDGRVATSVDEARKAIREAMADRNVALVLITDDLSEAEPESRDESAPLVVPIPCRTAERPSVALETQIRRTLGIHLEP